MLLHIPSINKCQDGLIRRLHSFRKVSCAEILEGLAVLIPSLMRNWNNFVLRSLRIDVNQKSLYERKKAGGEKGGSWVQNRITKI